MIYTLYYGMPHELVSHNHHDLCAIDLVVETAKSASVKLLQCCNHATHAFYKATPPIQPTPTM